MAKVLYGAKFLNVTLRLDSERISYALFRYFLRKRHLFLIAVTARELSCQDWLCNLYQLEKIDHAANIISYTFFGRGIRCDITRVGSVFFRAVTR